MPAFTIGIDLGGTNLRIAAIDRDGCQLESVATLTEVSRGREQVVAEITAATRRLREKYSASHRFLGVGIGLPGIIDVENGRLYSAANLPGWQAYDARDELARHLDAPVFLDNDANCAALGEKWLGAGSHVSDLCMITLGTGVGGGFVVNGKPWHGVLGMAGEIGHMTVIPEGRLCGCGNHGCLEQYASATAIRKAAMDAADSGASPALAAARKRDGTLTARTVFACAQTGDPAAKRIFADAGSALGIALANLINVFNLPLYVIGGGVSRAWAEFAPAMFEQLRTRSIVFRAGEEQKRTHRSTEVLPAMLEDRAGLLGAAHLPFILRPDCCSTIAV